MKYKIFQNNNPEICLDKIKLFHEYNNVMNIKIQRVLRSKKEGVMYSKHWKRNIFNQKYHNNY